MIEWCHWQLRESCVILEAHHDLFCQKRRLSWVSVIPNQQDVAIVHCMLQHAWSEPAYHI
jgi:hypothetical protein